MAAAAPGKDTMASVCPAKDCLRSTMNQPRAPAATATIVPARGAFTMNGNCSSWRSSSAIFQLRPVLVTVAPVMTCSTSAGRRIRVPVDVPGWRLRLAYDNEPAVRRAQYLDRGPVQRRQRLGRDHRLWRPADRGTRCDVSDEVEVGQDRVHVVRDQHDGHFLFAADP